MKIVIQRVTGADVKINGKIKDKIGKGLVALIAIHEKDNDSIIKKFADKILNLRIFSDENDKMNLSVKDIKGEILVISQFALYGDVTKGNRPSFMEPAKPEIAIPLYDKFVEYLRSSNVKIGTGEFGANMELSLINDGPVTIIIE